MLAGLIACAGTAPTAAESIDKPDSMPLTFRVDALSIRLYRQAGDAGPMSWQVHLRGAGGGILMHAGKPRPFPYSAKDRVALLNALYEIQFFDLPTRYAAHPVMLLKEDGTVSMAGRDATNATGNGVCVSVATFEKCVRYGNRAPVELDRIVQRVFADAQSLAGEP